VVSDAQSPAAQHVALTRQELAAFVLGVRPASAGDPLAELDRVLDRTTSAVRPGSALGTRRA